MDLDDITGHGRSDFAARTCGDRSLSGLFQVLALNLTGSRSTLFNFNFESAAFHKGNNRTLVQVFHLDQNSFSIHSYPNILSAFTHTHSFP